MEMNKSSPTYLFHMRVEGHILNYSDSKISDSVVGIVVIFCLSLREDNSRTSKPLCL